MDYQNTLKYLYESAPMFQQVGGDAYKPGLETTLKLDEHFGHPHREFKTIHIAGTNGKGSCSHTIAAILQSAGYRVGLYTSPHLVDFRERVRVNGETMPERYVVRFIEEHRSFFEPLHPSFFELTTAMAFRYFADRKVDVAVIETGMGGRLDCTNIITPVLSIITNISYDHMQYLGDTLPKIAYEKAGIIKEGVPVIIGRASEEVKEVFIAKATEMHAPIHFAEKLKGNYHFISTPFSELKKIRRELLETQFEREELKKLQGGPAPLNELKDFFLTFDPTNSLHDIERLIKKKKDAIIIMGDSFQIGIFAELSGACQQENALTILDSLNQLKANGFKISVRDYHVGFSNVCEMTGLMGRWQRMQMAPELVCDTAHNVDGIDLICKQLTQIHQHQHKNLHIVFGMVNDKDISSVLQLMPKDATYYFTKASVSRALPEDELMKQAVEAGLKGTSYPNVLEAVRAARKKCLPQDFIFVGGSTFIVADLLAHRNTLNLH